MAFTIPNYNDPNTGATIGYFAITRIIYDLLTPAIEVEVGSYINQADYADGMLPVAKQIFSINNSAGSTYSTFLSALTTADIPSGTPQGAVLTELIGALQIEMLTLPFFQNATIVP